MGDLPTPPAGTLPVILAAERVDAPPVFLRHKTTRREHLRPFAADAPDAFDTLLWSERGEITEFTRGNVIVDFDGGEKLTPPAALRPPGWRRPRAGTCSGKRA